VDPITTAIVATIPAVASDLVKSSVKDAYDGLKAVIRRKWGDAGAITKAINALEADPSSKAQAGVLAEKVAATKAAEEPEVIKALTVLVAELKEARIGGKTLAGIQVAIGGDMQGVVAEKVTIGTMSFGAPARDNK
jgi:hypothetical protein